MVTHITRTTTNVATVRKCFCRTFNWFYHRGSTSQKFTPGGGDGDRRPASLQTLNPLSPQSNWKQLVVSKTSFSIEHVANGVTAVSVAPGAAYLFSYFAKADIRHAAATRWLHCQGGILSTLARRCDRFTWKPLLPKPLWFLQRLQKVTKWLISLLGQFLLMAIYRNKSFTASHLVTIWFSQNLAPHPRPPSKLFIMNFFYIKRKQLLPLTSKYALITHMPQDTHLAVFCLHRWVSNVHVPLPKTGLQS